MLTRRQKGLGITMAVITTMAVVVFIICISSQSKVNAGNVLYAKEKQLVSLWTMASVASGPAIEVRNNPEPMTDAEEAKQAEPTAKVIELKPLNNHKIKKKKKKKYQSLKQVKQKLNREMDLSKPSGLSKKDFVKVIREMDYDYNGVFRKNAEFIWTLAQKYQVNEIFFAGIMANESLWCSSKAATSTNNYTSQMKGGKLVYYSSERKCIERTFQNLGNNYLRKNGKFYSGMTLYGVNERYCVPGEHKDGTPYKYKWADDVYRCMQIILGLRK